MPRREQTFNDPQRPVQREARLDQRERLFKNIERKVFVIREIRKYVQSHEHLPPEQFERACNEQVRLLFERFPPEIKEQYARYAELRKELEQVEDQVNRRLTELENQWGKEDLSDETRSEDLVLLGLEDHDNRIGVELDRFPIEQMIFFERVDIFFQDIIRKRKLVNKFEQSYKDEPEKFLKALPVGAEACAVLCREKDSVEVRFEGVMIQIILPSDLYNSIVSMNRKTSLGLHFRDTPFSLIRQREGQEETILHERNHNLTDSFIENPIYSEELLQSIQTRVSRIEMSEKIRAPQTIIDGEWRSILRTLEQYVFKNFDEIIADLDKHPREQVRSFLYCLLESIDVLEQYIQTLSNKIMRKKMNDGLRTLCDTAFRYLQKLASIFYLAETIGDVDDMHAALILFKPKQIRKVEQYVRHQIGEDRASIMDALRPLVFGGTYFSSIDRMEESFAFFSSHFSNQMLHRFQRTEGISSFDEANIRDLIALLQKKEKEGDDDFFDMIRQHISEQQIKDMDMNSVEFYEGRARDDPWCSLEHLLEINAFLTTLARIVRIPALEHFVEKKLSYGFYGHILDIAISSGDYSELTRVYTEWPFDKDELHQVLKDYAREFIFEEKAIAGGSEVITKEIVLRSPFWKFVHEVDLEEMLLPFLDKYERKNDQ